MQMILHTPAQRKGIDIRDMEKDSMRANMSAVFQDFISYQLTARENIAMGQVSKISDGEAILEAADKAGAGEVIRRLPHGIETELGPLFDNGYELSGGQWQKVALSRAFLKDAQVVILDEPTAALDPKA
ncbi:ABC transporter ATP-binding protein [Paenibacillus thiaminolyticus]|uniref:ABC transporter ATP-binding protein n=2 Tax=Paenibacillus thiaminolyticus TaxID=49283 RepID=A0AAP9J0D4_PANTH|nr:ABC transporter ATP-binding protein [Paenibacillus thiaminolyticus]SUA97811.1 subtilin transport ATP-binding protein SpaT [Paenibacillus thiaminolyticus]